MLSRLLALLAALVAYAPVLRYGFLINSSICANVSYIYGATSQPSEYPVPAPHEMCDIHGGDPPRTSPSSSWQPFHVFDSVPVPCPLRDALGDGPAHGGPGTSRPCWWWSIHAPSSGYSCSRVSWVILVELCSSLADLLPVGDHPPACEPTSRAITSFDLAPSCSRCIWVIRVELCSLAGSLPLGDHPPTAEPTSRVTIDLTPSFSCYSCVMLVLVELCPLARSLPLGDHSPNTEPRTFRVTTSLDLLACSCSPSTEPTSRLGAFSLPRRCHCLRSRHLPRRRRCLRLRRFLHRRRCLRMRLPRCRSRSLRAWHLLRRRCCLRSRHPRRRSRSSRARRLRCRHRFLQMRHFHRCSRSLRARRLLRLRHCLRSRRFLRRRRCLRERHFRRLSRCLGFHAPENFPARPCLFRCSSFT